MSKILIVQELYPESIFKWIGIVKSIFNGYMEMAFNGKEKTIVALRFPVEKIYREMSVYFYNHKIQRALCEFSIEENNIEVTINDYCSWYIFEKEEDNFFFDNKKEGSEHATKDDGE